MRRVILPLGLLAVAGLTPTAASAAHPCKPVSVTEGAKARVATVSVDCERGREVAATYYRRLAEGDHWDGKAHQAIYYEIDGFRCFTGLGGTQMTCKSRDRWVFASVRPEDHPGDWRVPHPSQHRPYWRHCAPASAVVSGDMLTHRVSCSKGRRVINKVLVKSQIAQTPHIHALGYTCGLRPYAMRPISCRKGAKRVLSPLAG